MCMIDSKLLVGLCHRCIWDAVALVTLDAVDWSTPITMFYIHRSPGSASEEAKVIIISCILYGVTYFFQTQ